MKTPAILLLALALAGCQSGGISPQEFIGGSVTSVRIAADATEKRFDSCVLASEAGSTDEAACVAERDAIGTHLVDASIGVNAAADAVIENDTEGLCASAARASDAVAAMFAVVQTQLSSQHFALVESFVQSEVRGCE